MSPTLQVPSLLYITVDGQVYPKQVQLIGIDEATYASVSQFGGYLQHPKNREQLSFALREDGYDVIDHQVADAAEASPREIMRTAGWVRRRGLAALRAQAEQEALRRTDAQAAAPPTAEPSGSSVEDPFAAHSAQLNEPQGEDFDPGRDQHVGIVLGMSVVGFRGPDNRDYFQAVPGDDVKAAFPLAVLPPKITSQEYTIVDIYESKMSEYDSIFGFVPLAALQRDRGMIDPKTGQGKFTCIQIKLKPGADIEVVRDRIQGAFDIQFYQVNTWRDEQGPLLAAVQMETAVLNVLLFMIIAVAGFGIFAIFLMIVVEKTRDIGILKSLGASGWGVMGIFLTYGLSLGLVGAGVGTGLGLLFIAYINEIADFLGWLTGQPVFDPSVYYFYKIPTMVEPLTVILIVIGSLIIAVGASVIPAMRAASLHPVKALRF
jgi:lipoprotein-releasing system permease protein